MKKSDLIEHYKDNMNIPNKKIIFLKNDKKIKFLVFLCNIDLIFLKCLHFFAKLYSINNI